MSKKYFPKHMLEDYPGGWKDYKLRKRSEVYAVEKALEKLWFGGAFMPTKVVKLAEAISLIREIKKDLRKGKWASYEG